MLPGTTDGKIGGLMVPLVAGDQARGVINLLNMEREHAFGESEVRLLQTLAKSMSVALENARLFDETQRLLKETEQRDAELAIINSVQAGARGRARLPGHLDAGRRQDARDLRHAATSASVVYDARADR